MQNINWEMMTQFVFPEQLGIVEEVLSVEIKPIWQQVETEESVRLVGIYHIAATARFNPSELPEYSDGTFIEDLELDGNNGYFEYALPLEVDLPREKVANNCQPQIHINDISFFVYDGSNCTFKWDVDCGFEEVVEGALFQHEPVIPMSNDEPIIPQVASIDFDDILLPNETKITEEIRFGNDAIFPEQPVVPEESANEFMLTKGQTSIEDPEVNIEKMSAPLNKTKKYESSIVKQIPTFEFGDGTLINNNEESTTEQIIKDKVVETNQYFPTDTDDFYNDLKESYTPLNFSNKIIRE